MIIDQLFEDDDKKKKLNEIDPRNYDSDEDYYNDLYGDDDDEDFDGDAADDEVADMDNDEESHYEKYVRVNNLEEEMPVIGQATGTNSQTDTPPNRSFGVMIKYTLPGKDGNGAVKVWQALETVLPRDYPRVPFQQQSTREPQARVLADLRNDQFSIVKQNISSQDIAETIASKFEGKGIPAEVIDGGVYEEAMGRKTDAKGRTQQQWIQAVYKKFPDARIVQAKMIDGPCHAMLPDGRKFSWTPVQGMAEAKASTAAFRASNAKRAKLNAMSPEERKEYDKEQAEKQRKRDDARLEKERQKLAAKKGIDEDLNRRGFLQGLGMAAAGAAGLSAAGAAQARATPDWMEKVKRAKALMAKGQSREQTARIMGIKGPNPGGAGPMSGDWGAVNYAAQEMRVKESTTPKQRKLNEAMLMEDPIYRKFKGVGRYIAERRMSEKEILQVFADAEAGMTDKGTGANRTFLGRGKDTTMDFAGGVKDAVSGVLNSIQNSVPVRAVDVAWDQATDAMANMTGGQKGAVMQAITKYRNLAKQYPKTAGFAKAALVAIAGLATGGAGLPAIAGLTYALDSAIKGDKLSSVLGKGAGAAALSAAAQGVYNAMTPPPGAEGLDPSQFPAYDDDGNLMPGFHINPESGQTYYDPGLPDEVAGPAGDSLAPSRFDAIVDNAVDYKVKQGDTLSDILADRKINPEAFKRLPGNEVFFGPDGNPNLLKAGQTIKLPDPADIADLNKMSWTTPSDPNLAKDFGNPDFYTGQYNQNSTSGLDAANNLKQQELGRWGSDNGMSAARAAKDAGGGMDLGGSTDLPSNPSAASDYGMGGNAPIDYSQPGPISTDSLGQKLEYGMPVSDNGSFIPPNPKLPAEELATQQAAYDAWKADFMRRFPNATQLPDGSLQGIKPGLAPMYPTNYTPGMDTGGLTPKAVQESIKFKKLPFEKLVDQKSTVMNWALSESIGVKSKSVHLSAVGTYTVFENVDRYRKAIMELAGVPGSTRPEFYRPDMPGGPGKQSKPGIIGKGLNWLDKAAGKVGGALSNFGHQFTTNVTKEKLKMDWHQAGKPSDSDALAAWLVKQGVPQDVVTTVYGKMGIPYTAPAATTAAEPTGATAAKPAVGAAQKQMPFYGTNPKTQKPWTYDELQAKATAGQAAPAAPAAPAATTTTAANPAGFNAGNVMKLPGMEKYATKPAPAKAPNFAQQGGGYAQINQPTTVSYSTGTKPATTAAAVSGPMKIGGQTLNPKNPADKKIIDKVQAQTAKVAEALKRPVAEMLSMVETKEDVAKIKQFVDQTFVKYGAVSESAFVVRNKLIEHITQVGAQRRREFARKS